VNCPPTSSAGRWFDAAAGALGLSLRQAHEAEAAMALERGAAPCWRPAPDLPVEGRPRASPASLLARLLAGRPATTDCDAAAPRGSTALADGLVQAAHRRCARPAARVRCALGGGCFFNRCSCTVSRWPAGRGLRVLRPQAHVLRRRRPGARPGLGGGAAAGVHSAPGTSASRTQPVTLNHVPGHSRPPGA
jgi:hydrogenase maturation protein HypF